MSIYTREPQHCHRDTSNQNSLGPFAVDTHLLTPARTATGLLLPHRSMLLFSSCIRWKYTMCRGIGYVGLQ